MNKGFKYYFKDSLKETNNTFKNKSNYFRFYLIKIAIILSNLIIIFKPLLKICEQKMVRIIKKQNSISISEVYVDVEKNVFIKGILVSFIKTILFLSGVVSIGIFSLMLAFIGYLIAYSMNSFEIITICIIFSIPGLVFLLGFIIYMPMILSPSYYIIQANDSLTSGDAIKKSINAMKKDGKITYIVTNLLHLAFLVVNALLFIALFYGFNQTFSDFLRYLFICLIAFLIVEFIILYPRFESVRKLILFSMFQDITSISDKNDKIKGIDILKVKKIINSNDSDLKELFEIQESTKIHKLVKLKSSKNEELLDIPLTYDVKQKEEKINLNEKEIKETKSKSKKKSDEINENLDSSKVEEVVEKSAEEKEVEAVEPVNEEVTEEVIEEEINNDNLDSSNDEEIIEETVEKSAEENEPEAVEPVNEEITEEEINNDINSSNDEEIVEEVIEEESNISEEEIKEESDNEELLDEARR